MTVKPKDIHMTYEQVQRFFDFINGDDIDFYEEYFMHLSFEEQRKFFDKNPSFMSSYPMWSKRMELLEDSVYRGILRKIKRYESRKMDLLKCPEYEKGNI